MSYRIKLEQFEGPLDLLLHLVVKSEMDIYDIQIAQITAQYLDYLSLMKAHQLDVAGEFLVMAATLLHIKSRTLLPASPRDEENDEGVDPRAELVQRLLEYRRYKEGAEKLEAYPQLNRDVFIRPEQSMQEEGPSEAVPADLNDSPVSLFELVEALRRVLQDKPPPAPHTIISSPWSVEQGMRLLRRRLNGEEYVSFEQCFSGVTGRSEVIVVFIAMLELVKLGQLRLVQLNPQGTIYLYPQPELHSDRCVAALAPHSCEEL
ncbi:MAG: segregation/condensation protein A [Desulfuromonadaceae bacterium]|nr:segregation/condensation protein A [Desulfuromonadaceae bacterium]